MHWGKKIEPSTGNWPIPIYNAFEKNQQKPQIKKKKSLTSAKLNAVAA